MYWFSHPKATWWVAPAALVLCAAAVLAPALLRATPRRFVTGAALLALATRVALNVSRDGPHELIVPLTGKEGRQEYLPTVARFVSDPTGYLRHFDDLIRTTLGDHPAGHPPGPTVILAGLNQIGLGGAWPAALLILIAGSLTVLPLYALACRVSDEPSARLAVLAWVFAPNVLLMSATSMDAVFGLVATVAAVLLVGRRAIAGGVVTAIASFLSYALLAIPVWALGVLLMRRTPPRMLFAKVAQAVAVIALGYLLLWMVTGYDPIAAYQATKQAYGQGISRRRPLWFWFFGDLAVFLLGLGLPAVVLWSRALSRLDAAAVALAVTLLVASGSGFAKAEVERIWLFLIPLAALSIGPQLRGLRLRPVLLMLVAQALLVEVLFGTTW